MAEPRTRSAFTIDVVSDVVCPWCYIGKRRLAAALNRIAQRRGDVDFRVSWHPFQLNPELPADGVDRKRYLEDKFGGPERAAEIYARVREAGASVGIPFAFERILLQPNTLDAHRLIGWAQRQRAADGLVEALFRAYFIDGRYLGDRARAGGDRRRRGLRRRRGAGDARRHRGCRRGALDGRAGARTGRHRRAVLHFRQSLRGLRGAGARGTGRGDRGGAGRRSRGRLILRKGRRVHRREDALLARPVPARGLPPGRCERRRRNAEPR